LQTAPVLRVLKIFPPSKFGRPGAVPFTKHGKECSAYSCLFWTENINENEIRRIEKKQKERDGANLFLMGGHSGYPKISDQAFRVLRISGFQNYYPKFAWEKKNPTIRVPEPENSGSDSSIPELPENMWDAS